MSKILIATRGSPLALAQTQSVIQALISSFPSLELEPLIVKTSGDLAQGSPKAGSLNKKAWVDALEEAITSRVASFAVHSGKDVPVDINPETQISSVLKRATPNDIFIGRLDHSSGKRLEFEKLSSAPKIGTSSIRRKAQILKKFPSAILSDMRGNVGTRIKKLDESDLDGIIIAAAGIERLSFPERQSGYLLALNEFAPAPLQGIICVQYSKNSNELMPLIESIQDPQTQSFFESERSFLISLGGSCATAAGCYTFFDNSKLVLNGSVYSRDGSEVINTQEVCNLTPAKLGEAVANKLLASGAGKYLS